MSKNRTFLSRVGAALLVSAVAVGMVGAVYWVHHTKKEAGELSPDNDPGAKRLDANTIELPPEAVQSLRIQTEKVTFTEKPRPLPPLSGSLALDINTLTHVNSRFAGELMEIGTHPADDQGNPKPGERLLNVGDKVKPSQQLAV